MEQAERLDYLQKKYPNIPEYALPIKGGKKKSKSNQLTDDVIRHLKSLGGMAYRLSSQGQFDAKQGRWRPGGQKRGLPDVIGILPNGCFIGIEVKIKYDKMSEFQNMRKAEILNSNGYYLITRNLEDFKNELKQIIDK